jgi:hypothetical protein
MGCLHVFMFQKVKATQLAGKFSYQEPVVPIALMSVSLRATTYLHKTMHVLIIEYRDNIINASLIHIQIVKKFSIKEE